jgi:hypothetical protein
VSIGVLRDAACPVLVLPRGVVDPFAWGADRVGEVGEVGEPGVSEAEVRTRGVREALAGARGAAGGGQR